MSCLNGKSLVLRYMHDILKNGIECSSDIGVILAIPLPTQIPATNVGFVTRNWRLWNAYFPWTPVSL